MRGLAGLEIGVVHLCSQPEQADGEESTGTASNQAACANGQGSE